MRKVLLLLIIASCSLLSYAQCDICGQVLTPVYNTFSVKNDKEYIKTLFNIYESSETQYNQQRSKQGLSLILPEYGSAKYNSNKEKIKNIHNTVSQTTDFKLSVNEHIEIFNQTVSDEVRIAQLSNFSKCIAECNGRPYLNLVSYSENEAVLILHLPLNSHNSGKKSKVNNISLSNNLKWKEETLSKGDKIRYGESYTITLIRDSNEVQSVSIDLSKENFIFAQIPKFKKEPVKEWIWKNTSDNGDVLKVISDVVVINPVKKTKLGTKKKGPFGTGGRKKVTYYAPGSNGGSIALNLPSQNHRFESVFLTLISGGVSKESHKVVVKDNKLYLDYQVNANVASKVEIKYIVHYQKLVETCVKNCE